ncbi:protein TIFY 8-like isoform X3 [Musa acuminata AAA Group]|uniref:protein TIFY 8-like isoform X3 n=1 Tax=Musa acuminata AAA Group TaxID=214697 RepID=UPI0031E2E1FA
MDMGRDESKQKENPCFHDFLGMSVHCAEKTPPPDLLSSGGHSGAADDAYAASVVVSAARHRGLMSPTCDLGSERQGVKGSEVFHFHGRKSAVPGPDVGNTLSGRKRSCSESIHSGSINRVHPVCSDSLESSCLVKMFGKEVVSEHLGKSHDDKIMLSMLRPPRPTSLILHPLSSISDSPTSKEEQSLSKNSGQISNHAPRFSQAGMYLDDGSQTAIGGSGVMSTDNPINMAFGRNSTGFLNKPKSSLAIESEPSNIVRRSTTSSAGRQMTIFYAGQAHVFDNVQPNKADVIMALARINGGSWSTSHSSKSSERTTMNEAKVPVHGDMGHGISQLAGIPLAGVLSGVTSRGGTIGRDGRSMTQATEPTMGDRRDA